MTKKIIEYNNVTIKRGDTAVLSNVTFDILPGQLIYLTGLVGSGKSTLLKSLYAQLPIASGSAQVLEYDLTTIRRGRISALRRQLGIVFQDFQLLMDRNVFDNLKFVLKATGWRRDEDIDTRIEWALKQVEMISRAYHMPHQLSGGEQQRIAIARALLNAPQLIIADEPTGNLDHDTAASIMRLLHNIAHAGTAVIIATHNRTLINEFPAEEMVCQGGTIKKIITKA